jgi:phosphonate metabolism-associated iron-containing alcohol dehydrogenase
MNLSIVSVSLPWPEGREPMAWKYGNPVQIEFGVDSFGKLPGLIAGRQYALVTYGEPFFGELAQRLEKAAGVAALTIRDVAPNPDYQLLSEQTRRFVALPSRPDVIIALGGGSVIDSAKVFAAASGDFEKVKTFLETRKGAEHLSAIPIIAVPTTAGTGSEVTCWGTVWDEANGRKYSLARPDLYPTHAVVDPRLMLGKPLLLTISTGLDALSHSLESLWNVNGNPVSANHAVFAARNILNVLPKLAGDLGNIELRGQMAMAALFAGLAFSNTKTAVAHSLSYPITLRHGVQHGIACSFSLPMVLRSVQGAGGLCEDSLKQIFGADLHRGADDLEQFLETLGISCNPATYRIDRKEWRELIAESLQGERGRNFLGSHDRLLEASSVVSLPKAKTA